MRVVGHHEHAISEHGDAAIDSAGRISGQALTARTAVVPDLAATSRIECVSLVDRGDVHHAIHYHRGYLKRARRAREGKDPLGCEPLHICRVDLVKRAEAVAVHVAVVSGPG